MTHSRLFIISASEQLPVVVAARAQLQRALQQQCHVKPWNLAFDLSAAYIESLERAADEADFALVLLGGDDVTISREKKQPSPRDNVTFELGLFMGRLGRERCYLLREDKADLKLCSDLAGVKSASFTKPDDGDWEHALSPACAEITERVMQLGPRDKLSDEERNSRDIIRDFCARLTGAWWERIALKGGQHALSFFHIEDDPLFNSVSIVRGDTYNSEGHLTAHWSSVMTRTDPSKKNGLLYHWKGEHTDPEEAKTPLHGFGEVEFDPPEKGGKLCMRGKGKFWSVDEACPERTIPKPMQFRRVTDPATIATMTTGSEKEIRTLVKKTLDRW
jgi:hypothetical protein